jgi:hypothetical protein
MPNLFVRILSALIVATFAIGPLLQLSSPPGKRAEPWRIADQREIQVDGTPVTLSPDGQWIAGIGPDQEFCVWAVADLAATCAVSEIRPMIESIAWAPDSSAVAFSDNAAQYFVDSDIMVFEIESMTLRNLTDSPDEVQKPSIGNREEGPTLMDVFPAWAPDSTSLVFLRGEFGPEHGSTRIMRLDLATGDIERFFTVSGTELLTVYSPMFFQPDGSLLISVQPAELSSAQHGIWRIDADGSRIDRVLAGGENADFALPRMTDIAADGSAVTLVSMGALMQGTGNRSPYAVLDLETGDLARVPDPDAGSAVSRLRGPVSFIGDGDEVMYLTLDQATVALTIGREDPVTLDGRFAAGRAERGLDWAENNTVLIPGPEGTAVLLTLEPGGDEDKDNDKVSTPVPPCGCTEPID